ncbi:hypothetical protein Ahia01_000783500 [Argonauta hians]
MCITMRLFTVCLAVLLYNGCCSQSHQPGNNRMTSQEQLRRTSDITTMNTMYTTDTISITDTNSTDTNNVTTTSNTTNTTTTPSIVHPTNFSHTTNTTDITDTITNTSTPSQYFQLMSESTNITGTNTSIFQEDSGNQTSMLNTSSVAWNTSRMAEVGILQNANNLTEAASSEIFGESLNNDTILPCSGYLPDESNVHQFQVFAFERWVIQKCHYGLVWNQELCQCDWAPGHQFFSSTEEGGCHLTLNITFSESIVRDYAQNAFISVEQTVEVQPSDRDGQQNSHSGFFNPGLLRILFFAGNSYSSHLNIEIYFKSTQMSNNSSEMVILSNACYNSLGNISDSTLSLSLIPQTNVVRFSINGYYEDSQANLETNSWHLVNITIHHNQVVINMDGEEILHSSKFPESIWDSQCPLTIGGDPTSQNYFYGFIDDVLLWRQCSAE